MKRTTRFILFLSIFGFSLLSACGGQPSTEVTTPPNANHLLKFDQDGFAVLRGHISGGSSSSNTNTLKIDLPARVEGIDATVAIRLTLRPETEISSSLTPNTTVREYSIFNTGSTAYNAFPPYALVDITFLKKDAALEVAAIHEATQKFTLFQKRAVIENVFSTDFSSQGMLSGSISQALKENDGSITWLVSIPIDMQGIQAAVILPVHSATDTQIITSDGVFVSSTSLISWESVQIQFTRKGDTLTARQITEMP